MQLGAEVSAILTDAAGSRVTGVALADGSRMEADIVVCNRDLASAYQLLEGLEPDSGSSGSSGSEGSTSSSSSVASGNSQAPTTLSPAAAAYGRQQHERLGRLKYSAGVIAYNWSVGQRVEGLQHHNVFLSEPEQAQRAWRPATRPEELCRHPNFYVHVPSRTDPSAAPEGCDSIMVLLPVASQQQMGGADYGALVEAGRQRILQASGQGLLSLEWGRPLRPAARLLQFAWGCISADLLAAPQHCLPCRCALLLLPLLLLLSPTPSSTPAALPTSPLPALPTQQSFADAGLGDVGSCIQHELVIAPPDWERRYGLRHGAAFGLAHGLDQLSLFR